MIPIVCNTTRSKLNWNCPTDSYGRGELGPQALGTPKPACRESSVSVETAVDEVVACSRQRTRKIHFAGIELCPLESGYLSCQLCRVPRMLRIRSIRGESELQLTVRDESNPIFTGLCPLGGGISDPCSQTTIPFAQNESIPSGRWCCTIANGESFWRVRRD